MWNERERGDGYCVPLYVCDCVSKRDKMCVLCACIQMKVVVICRVWVRRRRPKKRVRRREMVSERAEKKSVSTLMRVFVCRCGVRTEYPQKDSKT